MPRPKGSKNKSKVSSKSVRDILLGRFRMDELETFLNMTDAKGFKKNLLAFYFDMIPRLMPKVQELEGGKASSLTINLGAEETKENQPKIEREKNPVTEAPLSIHLNAQAEA